MTRYEYKAIPAPRQGEKSKAARTTSDRFANALTSLMNRLGAEGWEYLRADTLPCEERVGFTGRQTTFQHMLIFRRALAQPAPAAVTDAAQDAWPAPDVLAAMAPAAARTVAPERPAAPEPVAAPAPAAPMPGADPMDDAARRIGLVPTVARPVFGATPRLVATPLLSRRQTQATVARAARQEDAGT
jgi:hypothetical protein